MNNHTSVVEKKWVTGWRLGQLKPKPKKSTKLTQKLVSNIQKNRKLKQKNPTKLNPKKRKTEKPKPKKPKKTQNLIRKPVSKNRKKTKT